MKVCSNNKFIYTYNRTPDNFKKREIISNGQNNFTNNIKYNQLGFYRFHPSKITFKAQDDLPKDLYFIKMEMYPQNKNWAFEMNNATIQISSLMKKNTPFNKILSVIERKINKINYKPNSDKNLYGIRKVAEEGGFTLFDKHKTRGYEYYQKYKDYLNQKSESPIFAPKANDKYKTAITCRIMNSRCFVDVLYGINNQYNIQTNLDLVKIAYEELKSKENPTKKEIIDTAATIQWLITQECPYKKGSDSIANLLTRSLMHSYGIKISPLKEGISCDFEAFYRDLDDYIKIYPTLFTNNLRN